MFFISEHSSFNENEIYGTLIGIHENYLYSANSFDEELKIYRRKIMDTRNWELFWSGKISSRSRCSCSNSVSVAYGIVENEMFVAAFGKKQNNEESQFHLTSINLITYDIIDYKMENNIAENSSTLCNQCCLSSITSLNPENPFEISIIPWSPEIQATTFADCIQTTLSINPETKTCTILESVGLKVCGPNPMEPKMIHSNIGILEFGKILYFCNEELFLGRTNRSETKLEIVKDSDLQNCFYAGFYSAPNNSLQCIAFEENENENQLICSIFNVEINEEKLLAKFTKVSTLPSILLPSDPRFSKFILDSRMLIWSYQNQTFTYIFGALSLSEASYISLSNSYSLLFKEYQKLSTKKEYNHDDLFGIHNEAENFGLSQNGIKELLGLPKSFEFFIN